MNAQAVVEVVDLLDEVGIRAWIDGGWGVDALLEEQTREHADLDREIDVHTIDFDERGYGCFELPDGRRWPFPPSAFSARGRIGGRRVHCLSAGAQVQCHAQGYAPTENDLLDMQRLQERFGVGLPMILCRQQSRRSG